MSFRPVNTLNGPAQHDAKQHDHEPAQFMLGAAQIVLEAARFIHRREAESR